MARLPKLAAALASRTRVSDRQTAPDLGDFRKGGRDTLRGLSDQPHARAIAAAAAASTSATSG
jgi:hypothetical protein